MWSPPPGHTVLQKLNLVSRVLSYPPYGAAVLPRRTAKTANGVGLFGPITSRCQTNNETFNIEVQHTGILP